MKRLVKILKILLTSLVFLFITFYTSCILFHIMQSTPGTHSGHGEASTLVALAQSLIAVLVSIGLSLEAFNSLFGFERGYRGWQAKPWLEAVGWTAVIAFYTVYALRGLLES
jgi:hypothetical protein